MNESEIRDVFRYHSPSQAAVRLHERIRERMTETAVEVAGAIPPSRERSTYITLMQQAQMMANAAVAIHTPETATGEPEPPGAVRERPDGADPGRRYALPPTEGRVHLATTGQPDYRQKFAWAPPEGAAQVNVTVVPGEIDPRGAQLLWWCMPRHRNLLCLALVRGSEKRRELVFRTDVGVKHGDKQRHVRRPGPRWFRRGRAYRASCRYELGGSVRFRLADLERDELLVAIDAKANVDEWEPAVMVLGLGYPLFDDPAVQARHPIQPGWEWRDLEITN